MADNKLLPPTGTGTPNITVATDEIASVDYQRVKVDWGVDGSAVDASHADPLPVGSIATDSAAAGQVTVTNTSTTIVSARTGPPARRAVLLVNNQSVAVYIDPSGGTATTSLFRLDPGAGVELEVSCAVTGITSAAYSTSTDAKVHYIETF